MKKYLFMAVALVAAVSCAKVEMEEPCAPGARDLRTTFSALTPGAQTKTSLGEENDVLWSKSDSISIIYVNSKAEAENAKFTLYGEGGGTLGDFVGDLAEEAPEYYALFPYSEYTEFDAGTSEVTYVWTGYNQQATPGSFDPEAAPMMAYTTAEDKTLAFKNVMSFVKITTLFPCDKIVLKGNNGVALGRQDITVAMSEGVPAIVSSTPALHSMDNITLRSSIAADGGDIAPGTYLVAVLPQTLEKGFTISFEGVYGDFSKAYDVNIEDAVTLKRATILNMGSFSLDMFVKVGEWDGSGTQEDPYQITSPEQLCLLAERLQGEDAAQYQSAYYRQTMDIDFQGRRSPAIGTKNPFKGTYDGNYKKISNYIPIWDRSCMALFSQVEGAKITRVISEPLRYDCRIDYRKYPRIYYGGLVGWVYGSGDRGSKFTVIDDCKVNAYGGGEIQIDAGYQNVFYGGICCESDGDLIIRNCIDDMDIRIVGEAYLNNYEDYDHYCYVGGIITNVRPNLEDRVVYIDGCVNSGNIKINVSKAVYAGGIVAYDTDWAEQSDVTLRISNCTNSGDILHCSGETKAVSRLSVIGGMVGMHDSDGDWGVDPWVVNCLNTGALHSNSFDESRVGGMMGYCYSSLLAEYTDFYVCLNSGALTAVGKSHIGAMCGYDGGEYHNCYWTNSGLKIVADDDSYSHAEDSIYGAEFIGPFMNGMLSQIPASVTAPETSPYAFPIEPYSWLGKTSDSSISLSAL